MCVGAGTLHFPTRSLSPSPSLSPSLYRPSLNVHGWLKERVRGSYLGWATVSPGAGVTSRPAGEMFPARWSTANWRHGPSWLELRGRRYTCHTGAVKSPLLQPKGLWNDRGVQKYPTSGHFLVQMWRYRGFEVVVGEGGCGNLRTRKVMSKKSFHKEMFLHDKV